MRNIENRPEAFLNKTQQFCSIITQGAEAHLKQGSDHAAGLASLPPKLGGQPARRKGTHHEPQDHGGEEKNLKTATGD